MLCSVRLNARRDAAREKRGTTVKMWAAVVVVVLLSAAPMCVSALTVSVAEFRLAPEAGSQIEASLIVVNDESRDVALSVRVTDWDDGSDGVTRLLEAGEIERPCSSWVSLSESGIVLGPREESALRFAIRIPTDVRGTYWTGLVFRDASPSAAVASESLVRIFVTVPSARFEAAVTNVSVVSLVPLSVSARLANLGDARFCDVQGLVSVEGPNGDVASLSLSPFNLLPGHAREVTGATSWGLDIPGTYLVRLVFDYGGDALAAGQIILRVP